MKKKGLIISTIVMVLVLVVSLSTATFAWFSAQAQATVDDLNVTTTAAEGLQIAMVNGNDLNTIVSGDLTYDGVWNGADGFGSYLNFGSLTTMGASRMEDAVTQIVKGTQLSVVNANYPAPREGLESKFTGTAGALTYTAADADKTKVHYVVKLAGKSDAIPFAYGSHYELTGATGSEVFKKLLSAPTVATDLYTMEIIALDTSNQATVSEGEFVAIDKLSTWETLLSGKFTGTGGTATLNEDIWLVPSGYDSETEPTGFELAAANYHYYVLKIAVTNTVAIQELGVAVQFVPKDSNGADVAAATNNKGMAAASRMDIASYKYNNTDFNTTAEGSSKEAPFGAYTRTSSGVWTVASGDTNDKVGQYGYLIEKQAGQTIAIGTTYMLQFGIWIEGTDRGECNNQTAGTGFNLKMAFVFGKTEAISFDNIEILKNWGKSAPTNLFA